VVVDRETVVKPDIANPAPGTLQRSRRRLWLDERHLDGLPTRHRGVALLISAVPELAGQIDTLQYILKYTAEP